MGNKLNEFRVGISKKIWPIICALNKKVANPMKKICNVFTHVFLTD